MADSPPPMPTITTTTTTTTTDTDDTDTGTTATSTPSNLHLLRPMRPVERRTRREIANSNERRRMCSINAGFSSLRSLLPSYKGKRSSKESVLQDAINYISELKMNRNQMFMQNLKLRDLLYEQRSRMDGGGGNDEAAENLEIQLATERALRIQLEQKLQQMMALYPNGEMAATSEQLVTLNHHHHHDENELNDMNAETSSHPPVVIEEPPILIRRNSSEGSSSNDEHNYSAIDAAATSTNTITSSTNIIRVRPIARVQTLLTTAVPVASRRLVVTSSRRQSTDIAVDYSSEIANNFNRNGDSSDIILTTNSPSSSVDRNAVTTSFTLGNSMMIPGEHPEEYDQQIPPPTARVSSRQNFEMIVEAIRHIEGDGMFDESGVSVAAETDA